MLKRSGVLLGLHPYFRERQVYWNLWTALQVHLQGIKSAGRFLSLSPIKGNALCLTFKKGSCFFDVNKPKVSEEVAVNIKEVEISEMQVTFSITAIFVKVLLKTTIWHI